MHLRLIHRVKADGQPHVRIEVYRVAVFAHMICIYVLEYICHVVAQTDEMLFVCSVVFLDEDLELIICSVGGNGHLAGHLEKDVVLNAVDDSEPADNIEVVRFKREVIRYSFRFGLA